MKSNKIGIITASVAMVLASFSSILGMFNNSLYNDNEFVISMWTGNDAVTAIIVVPLLVYSIWKYTHSFGNEINSLLILLGGLWYLIYNYIFYLYGAKYNMLFVAYVLIIIMAAVSFAHLIVFNYPKLNEIIGTEYKKKSFKGIGIFMRSFAVILGSMWMIMIIIGLIKGEVPEAIVQTEHPTGVVFATDLIFLVTPLFVLGSYINSKNILIIIMSFAVLLKCAMYPMVFVVAGINTYINIGTYDPLTPVYLIMGLLSCYQLYKIKLKLSK